MRWLGCIVYNVYQQPWRQILISTGATAELRLANIYDEKLNWTENRHLFRLLEIFFSGENEPASKPLIFVFTIY